MTDDDLITWEEIRRAAVEANTGHDHTGSLDDHADLPMLRFVELIEMALDMAHD